jgi:hypothetical protein
MIQSFIRFAGASYTWYDNVHSGTVKIGRRGSMGRRLNGNTLTAVNGHLRPLRELVAYERDVGVGVPATVIS